MINCSKFAPLRVKFQTEARNAQQRRRLRLSNTLNPTTAIGIFLLEFSYQNFNKNSGRSYPVYRWMSVMNDEYHTEYPVHSF